MKSSKFHIGLLIACFCLAGCSRLAVDKNLDDLAVPVEKKKEASELHVQVESAFKTLSDGQVAQSKSATLLPEVDAMLRENRRRSLRAYLKVRPDLTLEVLRTHVAELPTSIPLKNLAAIYDEQLGIPAQRGWRALQDVDPRILVAYTETRKKLSDSMRVANSADQVAAELARHADAARSPMLHLDQIHCCAMAALVSDQPAKAVALLERGCGIAAEFDPYQEVQLALLLSDAQRRAGNVPLANQVWERTVVNAGQLVERNQLFDPVLWDRISYLRPIHIHWPESAIRSLATSLEWRQPDLNSAASDVNAESIVWAAVARGLNRRGDFQAALIAAKRAETHVTDSSIKGWTRLMQAESLTCLDQAPAATAILVGLSTNKDPQLAAAATASLGGLKLRQGDTRTGYSLLHKALTSSSNPHWPDRAKAEADLGLACLLRGDETNGLNWIHSAQSGFAGSEETLSLTQSLWNEAAYHKEKKRPEVEASVHAKIREIEGA